MNPVDLKITELHKQEFKNLQQSQLILELMVNHLTLY